MANDYLLQEDGGKIVFEDSSGDLILESSTGGGGGGTSHRRLLTMIRVGFCLAFMLLGCSGISLLHQVDNGSALSPEQVRAYREMNMDVYSCIALAGPPPNNVILTIIVPKETPQNFKFDDRCRLQ